MNRLVIIGNGFDLAHNLPTSYNNFINFFWKNLQNRLKEDFIHKFVEVHQNFNGFNKYDLPIECFKDFITCINKYAINHGLKEYKKIDGIKRVPQQNDVLKFANDFFRIICEDSIENWVDIENKYYEKLKDLVINKPSNQKTYPNDITKLNIEFDEIKLLLEEYLRNEVIGKFNFTPKNQNLEDILKIFQICPLFLDKNNDHPVFNEFPPEDHKELLEFDKKLIDVRFNNARWDSLLQETLFLDFNYTKTVSVYKEIINSRLMEGNVNASHIQIHGKINSEENHINFGFGDEMDNHYKMIEEVGDNAFLKNIKSFQYLHNSNYRKLLNWIETNKFQVLVLGHSCGLSDRTLLNTIFEHNNCRSIKIFYFKKNGKDNYTELTQNISRHFNKKALMRTKIVDKTICSELPQNARFQSIE